MVDTFEIDMLDLCDMCDGMYNAVEMLIELSKTCSLPGKSYYCEIFDGDGKRKIESPKIEHDKVSTVYTKSKEDRECMKITKLGKSPRFSYGYIKSKDCKITFYFFGVDEKLPEIIKNKFIERQRKKEELKMKMKDIDPYGEEEWENESIKILESKMISKFKIFEELTNPYDETPPLVYSQYFQTNYDGFRQELLDDLKTKLIGNTIYIDGNRRYNDYREPKDPLENIIDSNGRHLTPFYKITVKDVQYNGSHRQQIYHVEIISDDNKRYTLKKILPEKAYLNFVKKAGAALEKIEEEKRRKERLKLKHLYHDPYGEENWDEYDSDFK